ncbi:MAG: hypothetical protein AAGJ46_10885 [Planctomycetota bacterium]
MVDTDAKLTDHEIDRLILHPGLSTAEALSDVSGRGVGILIKPDELLHEIEPVD